MPSRDKHHRYALTAFAITLISICFLALVGVGEKYISNHYTRKQAEHREQSSSNDVRAISDAIRDFDPLDDTIAQWIMAICGVIATVVSAVAIFYLRLTLMETRAIGQAQVRAYLAFNIKSVEVHQVGFDNGPHASVKFIGKIVNSGQSPAFMIRTLVEISLADSRQGRWVSADGTGLQEGQPIAMPIAANSEIEHSAADRVAASKDDIIAGNVQVRIIYALKYKDVFGVECCSFLCSGVIKREREGGKIAYVADPIHGVSHG